MGKSDVLPNKVVVRSLLRCLLRIAGKFDRKPEAKLVLYRKTSSPSYLTAKEAYYQSIIRRIFGEDSISYFLSPKQAETISLQKIVMSEFRREGEDLPSANDRVDIAFSIVKKYSAIWSAFCDLQAKDESSTSHEHGANFTTTTAATTESATADSVTSSKKSHDEPYSEHELDILKKLEHLEVKEVSSAIEPGMLLLAHPMVHGELRKTVILVLEHSAVGSYGVVINLPTDVTLAAGVKNLPTELAKLLGHTPLMKGGLVRRLQCIHPIPDCGGSPIPYSEGLAFSGADASKLIE